MGIPHWSAKKKEGRALPDLLFVYRNFTVFYRVPVGGGRDTSIGVGAVTGAV